MSFYNLIGNYCFQEQTIEEIGTGKIFTACSKKKLFHEDFYAIERFSYATSQGWGKSRENLYKFSLMPDGYTLEIYVCDYEEARTVIEQNFDSLLKGKADPNKMIKELNELLNKEKTI